ncbi:soluble lytic murein transglycosylase-like protein [Rhizobium sp. SG_E_25_P2]|uniref:lytic transglycosylase domain-containing protein n=1 Tax=Rhizobium sp. SG_E_25_P2 TaxID=2879942 RepID=UPI0024761160|nr:lytic transglycosylase domain-containing protein [Rhizobium sp. SG_E_25_P2]MDH6269207.1 soluble lytic murein transglycosylase-like protein [Rhizobium sp. SG_E_25_P2]
MKKYVTHATRIALISGAVGLTASCQSAKVSAAKVDVKPAAQQVAMTTQLQTVNTSSTAMLTTAPAPISPVDLATDKTISMAYAIPSPKPITDAAQAFNAVEVASVDPAAMGLPTPTSVPTPILQQQATVGEATVQPVTAANPAAPQTAAAPAAAQPLATQPRKTAVMADSFGQPDVAAVFAIRMGGPAAPTAKAATSVQVASADPSAATAFAAQPAASAFEPVVTSSKNTDLNQLISKYAALYEVPEHLVHKVVRRESNYNPGAVHRGNWGLMQIRYRTAKGMGYAGSPNGLLDAETNLKYAVKYLRGAWLTADKDVAKADWLYRTGYYYQAKRKQLLEVIHAD